MRARGRPRRWEPNEEDPPVPSGEDRITALALVRALAKERPDDARAIWREDRGVQVGQAGLAYAALLVTQLSEVLTEAGAEKCRVDHLIDRLMFAALRDVRPASEPSPDP